MALISQISKSDAGVYEVVLKDDRGKDTSTLNLTDQGKGSRINRSNFQHEYCQYIADKDQLLLLSRFQRLDE